MKRKLKFAWSNGKKSTKFGEANKCKTTTNSTWKKQISEKDYQSKTQSEWVILEGKHK